MLSRERRLFFLGWLRNPWSYGCPVPSSKVLARAMADELAKLDPEEYVVELGPGSGVVTRALCKNGLPQKQLILIERDDAFIEQLKLDFPEALLVQDDACNLQSILQKRGIHHVAAVVSSLPLLAMPDKVRSSIVQAVFHILKPNGVLIQYTYGINSPVSKRHQHAIGIRGRIAKRIWRNFPPARVWRYTALV